MRCGRCGAAMQPGYRFCTECGNSLTDATGTLSNSSSCPRCGAQNDPGSSSCMVCGSPLNSPSMALRTDPGAARPIGMRGSAAPAAMPGAVANRVPGAAPAARPGGGANRAPGAAPAAMPGGGANRAPSAAPAAMPGGGASRVPGAAPAAMPGGGANRAPGAAPAAMAASAPAGRSPAIPGAPATQTAAASMTASEPSLNLARGETMRLSTPTTVAGSNSSAVVFATDDHLVMMPPGGVPKVEKVRHAMVSDYDGDEKQELALFTDRSIWFVKNSEAGSASNLINNPQPVPEHLMKAPFTYQGRTVLISVSKEKIVFYILDSTSGLLEIGSTPTPQVYT